MKMKDVIVIDLYSPSSYNIGFNIDENKINKIIKDIKTTGSLWLIVNNLKTNEETNPIGFELAERFLKYNLVLRNIIIWFNIGDNSNKYYLSNRYTSILFFVKNPNEYYFNKDLIREKHIWKDVEWGKREKRYNPLGKDPSNVWLMTEDDGNGKITKHIPLNYEDVINRIKLVTCPTNGNITIYSDTKIHLKDIEYKTTSELLEKKIQALHRIDIFNNKKESNKDKLSYRIINRTSENMIELKNEEIDLIVTSPPYWDIKNYGVSNQIGYKESYELYLSRIYKVWKECYRVLNKNGTFWLNINNKMHKRSLKLIHYDFYKQCIKLGFKLWDIIIWHKSVSGPAPSNNLTDKFEYVLVFYKNPGFYFKKSYENEFCDYKIKNINLMGNVWNINRFWGNIGEDYPHPAMYPDELIERILQYGSIEKDLVLDPFIGSGTTLIVSKRLGRSCIGYEINTDYSQILQHRLHEEGLDNLFHQNTRVEFVH